MDYAEAYLWPRDEWLRTMMVMTLDGATVGPDGLSGSISGPADKRVFMEARRLSDAVLVGAGTIRAERYKPMRAKAEWQESRAQAGLAVAPRVVIVSGRLDLPWDEALFAESAFPVTVVTHEAADEQALSVAREHADVQIIGDETVDLPQLVAWMRSEGMRRIVCEGGEAILDSMVREDLVDEMDLTISPFLAGDGYLPDAVSDARDAIRGYYPRFAVAHQFEEDGFVFCRFVRHDAMT